MTRHAKASSARSNQRQAGGLGRAVRGAFATRGASGEVAGSSAPSAGRPAALALAIAALLLLAFAPVASAAPKTLVGAIGSAGSGAGQIGAGVGLAINRTGNGGVPAGSIYVVDSTNHRIDEFAPAGTTGTFERAFGANVGGAGVNVCTSSCVAGTAGTAAGQLSAFGAASIAVDQANGIVYVSDKTNRRINVFSATGTFQGAFGWGAETGAAAFQYCTTTCHAPGTTAPRTGNVPGGQFGSTIGGLAVDSAGKVYVADIFSRRIDVFAPTIAGGAVTAVAFTRTFGWGVLNGLAEFQVCNAPSTCHAPAAAGGAPGQFASNSPADVAVDAAGNVYALNSASSLQVPAEVQKFDTTPAPVPAASFDASAALAAAFGGSNLRFLAFDPEANHLYVSAGSLRVAELTSTGSAVSVHGGTLSINAGGLAVAPAGLGGNIYISDNGGASSQQIDVLNEGPRIDPVTTYTGTTATFSGSVLSENSPVGYHFEYSSDGTNWTSVPASDVNVPATPGRVAVSQSATGLSSSQHYQVRLVQTMPVTGFSAPSEEVAFTTRGPLVTNTEVLWPSVTTGAATVSAQVNPNGDATTYAFQYVTQAQFEAGGFTDATEAPVGGAPVSGGAPLDEPVTVSQRLSGLEAATTYHFRITSSNASAGATGPELSFTTYPVEASFGACPNDAFRTGPSANLPDCRAYEQASPVNKLGSRIRWGAEVARASPSGDRITFADNSNLPGAGGSTSASIFLASREGGKWDTNGLLPLPEPGFKASFLGWNEDLSTTAAMIASGSDAGVYLRDSVTGTQQLALPGEEGLQEGLAGFAGDSSQLVYQSTTVLAPGAVAGKPNVYGFEGGAASLVGRVPAFPETSCDDEGAHPCVPAPEGSLAGPYAWKSGHLTLGGSASGEENLTENVISGDGFRVFFTEVGSGRLFVREGGERTRQVSASQRAVADPHGEKAAAFVGAMPSGSKVFFLSCQMLTDDSTAVSVEAERTCSNVAKQGQDLYAYDAESGQLSDLTVDHEAGDTLGAQVVGFVGASEDGSNVYFVANGVLAPGATHGNCKIALAGAGGACNLYLYHEEAGHTPSISLVANLVGSGSNSDDPNWSAGGSRKTSRVAANGTVLFSSGQRLSSYDNHGAATELYRYAPGDTAPTCVSCDPTGAPPVGDASSGQAFFPASLHVEQSFEFQTRGISANGERIFFETPDKLVPADVDGDQSCPEVGVTGAGRILACLDVYEWEASGEGSCEEGGAAYVPADDGCIYLLSTGESSEPSIFGDASRSGEDVFIFTGSRLVPQDKDQLTDVYDASVNGGLASQYSAAATAPCEGEACRGASSSTPQGQGAGTAVFQGPGNPPVKHVKKHRKHKKKHRKHKKKSHHAKRNGGAK